MLKAAPRILYLGDDEWASLSWSLQRAFRALGGHVDFHDVTGRWELRWLAPRSIAARGLARVLRPWLPRLIQTRLTHATQGQHYDMIFCHKTMFLAAEFLDKLRHDLGARLFCFHPDDPFDEHPSRNNANTRALIPFTDCYFAWGRYRLVDLRDAGARRVEYLPFAHDPSLHRPVSGGAAPRSDPVPAVAFVGNFSRERVQWLEHLVGFDLGLWGHGWHSASTLEPGLEPFIKGPQRIGPAFAEIYGRCAIGLNLIQRCPDGHNMRSFEAPACGGFVMSNRTSELGELFAEDREIVCFADPEELKSKVTFYLKHPDLRAQIAQAGLKRVRPETYEKRAARILGVLAEEC